MNWLALAASLAAVLALAGLAWLLKLGRGGHAGRIDAGADAERLAEEALSGFRSLGAVVGADGQAALVAGRGGRVAVLKRHGARIAVRQVGWPQVRSSPDGILVETGDRRFGTVTIEGIDVLDIRRLAPQLTSV